MNIAATLRWAARRLLDPIRWDDGHQQLAAHPAFAACTRSEIRQVRRAGDFCTVPAGTVLCGEDRIGYWFFAVVSGSLRLTRKRRALATLGPGSHFGAIAILGFGPQGATVTAVTETMFFVLGRRNLIDLSLSLESLQHGLFPEVSPGGFQEKVRHLRMEGTAEWRRLPQGKAPPPGPGESLPPGLRAFPARGHAASGLGSPPLPFRVSEPRATQTPVSVPISKRAVAVVAACTIAAIGGVGFGYHPDVLVVRPHKSIDVTNDATITIDGPGRGGAPVTTREPSGRFIVTAVSIEQPTLVGAAWAVVTGRQTLPRDIGDEASVRRAARSEYLDSQQTAIRVVSAHAGLDPSRVHVEFRDRRLLGPSAGLVYALLLADMTNQIEVERGRVIAATGVLESDGRVSSVGFLPIKSEVAAAAHASLFLVPKDGGVGAKRASKLIVPVATFEDALRALDTAPKE